MLVKRKGWILVSMLVLVALVLAACQPVNEENGALATEPGLMETAPLATEPLATEPMATEPIATESMATEPVPETGAEPDVIVQDQAIENGTVTIEEVVSDGPGWIVIHADSSGGPGPDIGFAPVEDGSNSNVVVEIDESQATEVLHAMLHVDVGEMGTYEFPGDDIPVQIDGQMVSPTFMVSGLAAGEGDAASGGEGVALEVSSDSELGDFLVDGDGMTLYWFTNDEPGVSNCTGGCLEAWPPFLVDSVDDIQVGEGVDESLIGAIPFEGEGGGMLVTYDEYPLYYWQNDQEPGDTSGHGVNDVWFVVPPEGIDPDNPGGSSSSSDASPPGAY